MANAPDTTADSAEKAYAAAAAEVKPAKSTGPEVAAAPQEPAAAAKAKTRKAAPKKAVVKTRAATAAKKPAKARALASPTVNELKDKIMATAKTTDFAKPINEAIGEFQSRAKVAYEKGTEAFAEATEFAKGNVEAFVESGKILAGGVQDLGKTYVEEAKSAYETLTGDLKEMAAVKSPTELFQLQGKIVRRNFDVFVATGSKNTEAVLKLAGDAFAPISGRVNVAAERLGKVA
ncbi:MAG TPA: phasin family protein [Croceibacterium sp.]|nr:phasin family protein [Croceibacterium sp.]